MDQTETRQESKPMTAFPVHDEAHGAFMMLPPYSGTREGIVCMAHELQLEN